MMNKKQSLVSTLLSIALITSTNFLYAQHRATQASIDDELNDETLCQAIKSIVIQDEPTFTEKDLECAKILIQEFFTDYPQELSSLTQEEKAKTVAQIIFDINNFAFDERWFVDTNRINATIKKFEAKTEIKDEMRKYIIKVLEKIHYFKIPIKIKRALRAAILKRYNPRFDIGKVKTLSTYGLNLELAKTFNCSPNAAQKAFMAITRAYDIRSAFIYCLLAIPSILLSVIIVQEFNYDPAVSTEVFLVWLVFILSNLIVQAQKKTLQEYYET
jgi:hypothetical protein